MFKIRNKGYSLIELMVAAIVLAVAIAAIIAVVSKGRALDISDKHRRQARALIDSIMETQFNDRMFNFITDIDDSSTVVLDTRNGNHLTAILNRVVTTDPNYDINSTIITLKKVTITVSWNEPVSNPENITISKWIAEAR